MISNDSAEHPVHLAWANTRYGKVANVSLVPVKDCGLNSRSCAQECYGVRIVKMYNNTRRAWEINSSSFRDDPIAACMQVEKALKKKRAKPAMFRIHVAGDFLGQSHVDAWSDLASHFPEIMFLAYTKMDNLDFSKRTPNFEVIASQWPTASQLTIRGVTRNAWISFDPRTPSEALKCKYDIDKTTCDVCKFCWIGEGDVSFQDL